VENWKLLRREDIYILSTRHREKLKRELARGERITSAVDDTGIVIRVGGNDSNLLQENVGPKRVYEE
jgi:hypothetical protein